MNSSMNAVRLKTQEEPIFWLGLKTGKKNPESQPIQSGRRNSLFFSLFLSSVLTTQAHFPLGWSAGLCSPSHTILLHRSPEPPDFFIHEQGLLSQKTARVVGQQVHSGPLRACVGVAG